MTSLIIMIWTSFTVNDVNKSLQIQRCTILVVSLSIFSLTELK